MHRSARRDINLEYTTVGELYMHDRAGGVGERLPRRQWHALLGDRLYGRCPGVGYRRYRLHLIDRHRYWCSLIDRHRYWCSLHQQRTKACLGQPCLARKRFLQDFCFASVLQAASECERARNTPDAVDARFERL